MRRLIVCNIMSLDGHYEGPGKNVMDVFGYRRKVYPTDESFDLYNAERLRAAGTLLLGRSPSSRTRGVSQRSTEARRSRILGTRTATRSRSPRPGVRRRNEETEENE